MTHHGSPTGGRVSVGALSTSAVPGFFGAGEQAMRILLLNAVWLVTCLPLVTIVPATAALFEVTRDRVEQGQPRVLVPFLAALRHQFWRTSVVGAIMVGAAAILALDVAYVTQAGQTPATYMVLTVTVWCVLVYAATVALLFPTLVVAPHASWSAVLRTTILMAARHPRVALFSALLFAIASTICYFVPYAMALAPAAVAHGTYRICRQPLDMELSRQADLT